MKRPATRLVYVGLSLAVTVGVFSYLLTQISPSEVADVIRRADRRGVMMFLVLSFAMSVFRTWRYRLVLQTSGHLPRSVPLFLVVLVRNFFSDLLPARIGTLVYVYIVTHRLGVPFGAAVSSFALAFLFDLIALAPLVVAAALTVALTAGLPTAAFVGGGAVLAVLSGAALYYLPSIVHLAAWFLEHLAAATGGRVRRWGVSFADAEREIRRAQKAGIYLRLLVLSLLVRTAKYASLSLLLFALVRPLGHRIDLPDLPKVFIGLSASEMAASLPISGIAGFGAYEGTWAAVFRLLGFPGHLATVTGVSHHLFTQVYGYALGGLALVILLLPVFSPGQAPGAEIPGPSRARSFYLRIVLAVALTALVLLAIGAPLS